MKCKKCGKDINKDDLCCTNCGEKIETSAPLDNKENKKSRDVFKILLVINVIVFCIAIISLILISVFKLDLLMNNAFDVFTIFFAICIWLISILLLGIGFWGCFIASFILAIINLIVSIVNYKKLNHK